MTQEELNAKVAAILEAAREQPTRKYNVDLMICPTCVVPQIPRDELVGGKKDLYFGEKPFSNPVELAQVILHYAEKYNIERVFSMQDWLDEAEAERYDSIHKQVENEIEEWAAERAEIS